MTFAEYQHAALQTAVYPLDHRIHYPALGLAGEAGEIANKVKKLIRDGNNTYPNDVDINKLDEIAAEIGDVLWYCGALANDLGISLEFIAKDNIRKLQKRKDAGTLRGSGDNR